LNSTPLGRKVDLMFIRHSKNRARVSEPHVEVGCRAGGGGAMGRDTSHVALARGCGSWLAWLPVRVIVYKYLKNKISWPEDVAKGVVLPFSHFWPNKLAQ